MCKNLTVNIKVNFFAMTRCQMHAEITGLSYHAPYLVTGCARRLKKLHKQLEDPNLKHRFLPEYVKT